jgi:hypothetical protein
MEVIDGPRRLACGQPAPGLRLVDGPVCEASLTVSWQTGVSVRELAAIRQRLESAAGPSDLDALRA